MTTRHDPTRDIVLFDLDGTLVDSAPGILGSLHVAFAELGIEPAPGAVGRHLLGPPLYTTLPAVVGDEETAARVLAAYRAHYADVGLYDSVPYPGIDALLRELADTGVRLALATSKAEVFAEAILAHHGWNGLFAAIVGDTLDARRPTKAAVVEEALRRVGPGPGSAVVMVGDRRTDVVGAAAHGLACLGVAWGYAQPGELAEAGALKVVDDVAELAAALR